MAKKKKKAAKQKKGAKNEADLEEARDEMLALSAIFAEAMVVDEDQAGFNLRVVPHPGEAEANHVAIQLTVSYPRSYPHEELGLKLVEPQGLADADVKALSKQLHQTAAQYAAEGEICCFQLVNMCQEFLQERNFPAEEDSDEPPAPESLWHEMQQRESNAELATASAADVDFSFRASGFLGGDNWGFDDIGGSLFAEPADPVWSAAAVPSSPPPASVMGSGLATKPKTPKSPKAAARQLAGEATGHAFAHTKRQLPEGRTVTVAIARPAPADAAAAAGTGPSAGARQEEVTAATVGAQVFKEGTATAAGPAELPTDPVPAAAAEPAEQPVQPLDARPAEQREPSSRDVSVAGQRSPFESASEAGTSRSGAAEAAAAVAATNAPSISRVNTMLTAMKQSISAVSKAVLPKLLRRQLEGQHSESASEDGDSTAGVPENDAERDQIRRELLMGHLLTLAASGGNAAVPPHALPAVAAMLQSQSLLPKWVGWTLTQQPALFDRAFQRLFSQEMQRRSSSGGSSDQQDPSVSWAIDRFWQRRPMLASRSLNTLRSKPLGMLNNDGQQPASRYETDFAEIRQLGRGGYGVVMAAVNRMDGRQYAIKKILLDAHSPHAYARIMREVTTLSRLQHPNVVRYYQAWVETTTAAGVGHVGDSESEGSEWGGSSSLTPSLQPSSPAATAAAAIRRHSPRSGAAAAGVAGMGVTPGRGGGLRAVTAPVPTAGRGVQPGGLYSVTENSREGRASSPSNWDTSRGGDASTVTTSSAEGGGGAWGGGLGNLAVADGARLLSSAHGSASRLTVLSGDSSTGPPWQSAYGGSDSDEDPDSGGAASSSTSSGGSSGSGSSGSGSSSAAGSESRSPDRGATGGDGTEGRPAGMPMSRGASGDTSSSAFTFERPASGTGGSGERGHGGARAAGQLAGGGSSSQPSLLPKGRSPRQRSVLFIQMEFCPRTLRDVLDAGPLEDADRWRVLRQILAGLAHIHSQGIIHRDLKPANIFYDSKGDIKLGDFGLAKFNVQGADGELPAMPAGPNAVPGTSGVGAGHASGTLRAGPSTLASEATGVCGTSMYISPEIANGWASYDEKVDLYSLGVVAFELWHPFSTGMERVVLLRDLRENDVMPADFEAANPVVCQLIRWLMAPNPAQRPTAKEVLRSDLLPATVGDEQLRDLLRSLPDNPATYDKVVDAVFNLSRGSEAPAADEAAGAPAPVQMAARDHIVECVKEVFCRHGAVPMFSLDVGFATAEDPKGAMQVVSPSGVKLALRYEMRQPFASWVVHQVAKGGSGSMLVEGFRRYELAWVQRRVSGQAGLPRSYLQADLDFVLPLARTSAEQLLGEAEVMSAVHDVLLELPECGQLEVRIGHRHLFELALQYVGVSRELRGSVAQLLSTASAASPLHAQARSKRWPSIRAGLEGLGLGQEAIGRCRQLVLQGAGEAEVALFRLRAYLSQSAGASRRHGGSHPLACLDDIQALLPHLAAWGLPTCQVVVDPLVPPHADYFTGVLFQFHALQEANGATAVVAVGGRYDGLLKMVWARQAGMAGISGPMPPMGAVGATLNVERLVALAAAAARWRRPVGGPAGLAKLSQADVLVCSRGGGGLLRERMQLVRSLWDAGVAAEMLHAAAPSLTDQYEYANSRGIPWLVIIQGATFSAADTVRVKHLERRLEEDVPVADLVRYLQAALAPHGASAGAYTSGPGMTNRGLVVREGEGEHGEGGEEPSTHGGGRAERERERRRGRERRDR